MATANKTRKSASVSTKQSAKERQRARQRQRQRQQAVLMGVVALTVLAAVVIAILLSNQPLEAVVPDEVKTAYTDFAAEGLMGTTEEGFYFLGAPDAPALLEEFSSFSCPACRQYHQTYIKNIKDKIRAGHVKFVYIPLTEFGGFSSAGMSRGALCAGEQGKFWEMHDLMFDWQVRYGPASNDFRRLSKAAGELGLDTARFDACLNSADTSALLARADTLRGQRSVNSTPNVFFDGVRIYPEMEGGGTVPDLSQLRGMIEAKVAQAGQ